MQTQLLSIFSEFLENFQFDYMWCALIVGVLVALCSALLGVTLVLKRFSFIGDGLSHVTFGAMAVAAVLGLTNNLYITMPITIIAAVLLLCFGGRKSKMNGDAALAMISVSALAIGYLIYNLSNSPNTSADVCATLFGSYTILTLGWPDVILCAVFTAIIVALYVIFYNKIFAITFDETFAKATGVKTRIYNVAIAVVIAVIIVLAMSLVGSLLISAFVIFPALCAMRVFKSFKSVVVCSAIVSVVCSLLGILASAFFDTPTGSTIVITDLIAFVIFYLIGLIKKKA